MGGLHRAFFLETCFAEVGGSLKDPFYGFFGQSGAAQVIHRTQSFRPHVGLSKMTKEHHHMSRLVWLREHMQYSDTLAQWLHRQFAYEFVEQPLAGCST